MPLDFPANPTNGQAYGSYIYNSTVGAWQAREDSRTVAILSSTVPTSANPGDIWVNTNDGISFVYYDDGTSAQWMELLPSGVPLLNTKANIAGDTFTGNVTAPRFISNVATGTAPFEVTSTTVVANLNADLLDGNHSTAFSPVAGSASITTVGTIGTGTWNATTIGVAKGGTGATTLTGYLKGNGTSAFTASATIPGSDISGNISGNAASVTGTVGVANGGTGATTGAGLIPIVPSSVSVGSGSSSVSSSGTVTFTGATSISLNNVFSSSYRHYRLVIDTPTVSANGNLFIRFRNGTTDDATNTYYQYWTMKRLNGTTQDNTGGPATGYSLYGFITNTNVYYAFTGDIMSPNISTTQSIVQGRGFGQDATTTYTVDSTVLFNTTRSFDGITFYTGGAQLTGTVKILGYL